jgi:hypothetical protein
MMAAQARRSRSATASRATRRRLAAEGCLLLRALLPAAGRGLGLVEECRDLVGVEVALGVGRRRGRCRLLRGLGLGSTSAVSTVWAAAACGRAIGVGTFSGMRLLLRLGDRFGAGASSAASAGSCVSAGSAKRRLRSALPARARQLPVRRRRGLLGLGQRLRRRLRLRRGFGRSASGAAASSTVFGPVELGVGRAVQIDRVVADVLSAFPPSVRSAPARIAPPVRRCARPAGSASVRSIGTISTGSVSTLPDVQRFRGAERDQAPNSG